jgi:hypothetical protein
MVAMEEELKLSCQVEKSGLFCRCTKHDGVSAHQGLQSVVATADHRCYRDFSSQTRIQNQSISHQEPVVTQVKTTESVVSMGINPRIEQNKLWLEFIQHIGELITDGGEIVPIFGAIGQGNINITLHFPKGEIACGMHRKSCDTFIRLKTGGGSITLVHI